MLLKQYDPYSIHTHFDCECPVPSEFPFNSRDFSSSISRMHAWDITKCNAQLIPSEAMIRHLMTADPILLRDLLILKSALNELKVHISSPKLESIINYIELTATHLAAHDHLGNWIRSKFGYELIQKIIEKCGRYKRLSFLGYEYKEDLEGILSKKLSNLVKHLENSKQIEAKEMIQDLGMNIILTVHGPMPNIDPDDMNFLSVFCLIKIMMFLFPDDKYVLYVSKIFKRALIEHQPINLYKLFVNLDS